MSGNIGIKDIEKYSRTFVIKAVQVLVGSRLGCERIRNECRPNGNDWFNLNILDNKSVTDMTKKCLESIVDGGECLSKMAWNICLEISLKTNDGDSIVLEYWILDNDVSPSSASEVTNTSVSSVYNKMSLLLKTLITLSRATPAYKISNKGQSGDSYVICYRVYACEKDILRKEIDDHFTQEIKIGSVRTGLNSLSLSLSYRLDMTICNKSVEALSNRSPQLLPLKKDHYTCEKAKVDRDISKPLILPFASPPKNSPAIPLIPDAPFAFLLDYKLDEKANIEDISKSPVIETKPTTQKEVQSGSPVKSNPIQIPNKDVRKRLIENKDSPINSSGDSFVFVPLRPPFGYDEPNELALMFNGPSPSFNSPEVTQDLSDISNQLALFESDMHELDTFVKSVCISDEEK